MGAISTLSRGVRIPVNNPTIVAVLFGFSAVTGTLGFVQNVAPEIFGILIGLVSLAISLLVNPFVWGGVVGMADDARKGSVGIDEFLRHGKDNYVELLVLMIGFLLLGVVLGTIMLVVWFVAVFVLIGVGVGLAGSGAGSPDALLGAMGGLTLVLLVVLVLASILVVAVPYFLLQFYVGAVVIEDKGIVDGFERGFSVLRNNLVSALGFDAVWITVSVASSLVSFGILWLLGGGGIAAVASMDGGTTATQAVGVVALGITQVVSIVLGTITSSFLYSYYAAFYRDVAVDGTGASTGSTGGDTDWRGVNGD